MSLRKNLTAERTERRVALLQPPRVDINVEEDIGNIPHVFVHRMSVTAHTEFAANRAEFDHALENAERQLFHLFYSDVEPWIRRAVQANYAGDNEEVSHCLGEVLNICRGRA